MHKFFHFLCVFIAILFLIFGLSGCAGRKLKKDDSYYNPTPPEDRGLSEPNTGSVSTAWSNSDEYRASNGLRLIKAAEGYAARVTGKPGGAGVTVAVLDTNVDLSHPELDGISATFEGLDSLYSDHGTHVAGTIAARRNGQGVHGVAYNAWLHAIEVLEDHEDSTYVFPTIGDSAAMVAAGIASAAGLKKSYRHVTIHGDLILDLWCRVPGLGYCQVDSDPSLEADIINMSLGGGDPIGEIGEAIKDAAGAGKIMVAALGNDGLTSPNGSPADNMKNQANGLGIAVGALGRSGRYGASFSNACGAVADYCVFAPGTSIRSTIQYGGYKALSGTSMAAPHVSGAAAVLMAAFPNKSPRQIVERLLSTADQPTFIKDEHLKPAERRGTVPGFEEDRMVSASYGAGILNLEKAMAPWGDVRVSTSGMRTASVKASSVSLPPGFRAPSDNSTLSNVVVYDEHMFPFFYDLNTAFRESEAPASNGALVGFLSSLGRSSVLPIGNMADIGFSYNGNVLNPKRRLGEEEVAEYWLHFRPAPNWDVTFGQGGNSVGFSNDFVLNRTRRTVFQDSLSVNPFAAFVGRGSAVSLDWQMNEKTKVDFSGKHGNGYFGSASTWLASVGLTRQIGGYLTVGARHGMLRENDAVMGIQSAGAFEAFSNATTHFFDVSMEVRLSNDFALFGGASRGIASGGLPKQNSLVSGISDISADSFIMGGELQNLFGKDHLTLTVGSPFRPSKATVQMNVPDAEIADGVVSYAARTVNLTPNGRETRLQFVYEIDGDWGGDLGGISLSAGGYMRMEPEHNEAADNEYGTAVKMRLRF